MIVYWLFFLFPALFALSGRARSANLISMHQSLRIGTLWWIFIIALTILIGLRHEVGGDWESYIRIFSGSDSISSIGEISLARDPGYQLLNIISANLGLGIYGVNVICAFIFSFGLALFCRSLPRPMLALAVSIPYLVIVVSMGYSRQAVALGLVMIGLVLLGRNKKLSFVVMVIIAMTLHKSAILMLPIAALSSTKNKFLVFLLMGVIFFLAFALFLADSVTTLYTNYTNTDDIASQSSGAFIRLAMNIVPSIIFLTFFKYFNLSATEKPLWRWFSLISLALMALYFIIPVSSAIDRVALYMIPLQMVVFSYLPDIFGKKNARHRWIMILIILYYTSVLFVWLNFATHSWYWLPYENLIFSDGIPKSYIGD